MKGLLVFLLCITAVFTAVGCTKPENNRSDFAYYFVLDKNAQEDGVVLYAVMKKDEKDSDKDKKPPIIEVFDGKDVSAAFELFFDGCKKAYTGTVKEYAVGKGLGEDGLTELRAYITNSPRLPAKRKTVMTENVDIYLKNKLEEAV